MDELLQLIIEAAAHALELVEPKLSTGVLLCLVAAPIAGFWLWIVWN